MNNLVVGDVDNRDGNGASQFDKNVSIANNGLFIIFERACAIGVEFDEDKYVDENFSDFDFNTINCFAFLMNLSSSCK